MIISIIAGMQKQYKNTDLVARGNVAEQGISPQAMPDDKSVAAELFIYTLMPDYSRITKREQKIRLALM